MEVSIGLGFLQQAYDDCGRDLSGTLGEEFSGEGIVMKKQWLALVFLLGLAMELVIYMVSAVLLGGFINRKLGLSFNAINITIPISVVLCIVAAVRFFDRLIKSETKKE